MFNNVIIALVILFLASCGSDPPAVSNNGDNNGSNNGGSNNGTSNNGTNNGVPCDDCASDEVCFEDACCAPVCAPGACGVVDDSCGGTIDCGDCTCTQETIDTFCPSKPCETAIGCLSDTECEYGPVMCGGFDCSCTDENCSDTDLRLCSDLTCGGPETCDPSPMDVEGSVEYQNVCAPAVDAPCEINGVCGPGVCAADTCEIDPCGTCGLGGWVCDMNNDTSCLDLPLPSTIDPAAVNCDDLSASTTFVYVDVATGIDDAAGGSKTSPFATLDYALTTAELRGNPAVIIGGAPTFGAVILRDGISIFGGFTEGPEFARNVELRPIIETTNATGNGVGITAIDITVQTVVSNIDVVVTDRSDTSDVYGIFLNNAKTIQFIDVEVNVGNAGNGTTGLPGNSGANGPSGSNGTGRHTRGFGGVSICSSNGGNGGTGANNGSGLSGQSGVGGASGGLGSTVNVPGNIGQNGTGGQQGFPGIATSDGSPDAATGFWTRGTGGNGFDGSGGNGGGGGGGSGGIDINFPSVDIDGGGGGGGGAGGCGGRGGRRGLSGGSSFGVYAVDSTGVRFLNTIVTGGNGGVGGNGGAGGSAGSGGLGGLGGSVGNTQGGRGGRGGNGGNGGGGAGGNGGEAFGVRCFTSTINIAGSTTFTGGTAGDFGLGGGPNGLVGTAGNSGGIDTDCL